ncbi:MAG TPA: hypothetical protein VM050_03085 [Patescibacteria group bacterium]|nr:hypothetical protein [Patescibacteria group bacterium]
MSRPFLSMALQAVTSLFVSAMSFYVLDVWLLFYFLDHLSPGMLFEGLSMTIIFIVLRVGVLGLSLGTLMGLEGFEWSRRSLSCLIKPWGIVAIPLLTTFTLWMDRLGGIIPGLSAALSRLSLVLLLFLLDQYRMIVFFRARKACSAPVTGAVEPIPLRTFYILGAVSMATFAILDLPLGVSRISSVTGALYFTLFILLRAGLAGFITYRNQGELVAKRLVTSIVLALALYGLPLNTTISGLPWPPYTFYLPQYDPVQNFLSLMGVPSPLAQLASGVFLALVYDLPRLLLLLGLLRSSLLRSRDPKA